MAELARDIMQRSVLTVTPGLPLAELEDFFITKRITGAPVVDRGRVVGVVSRSDIVRSLSLGRSLAGIEAEATGELEFAPGEEESEMPSADVARRAGGRTVADVMTTDPVAVRPDTTIRDVARILVERHLHRLLVVEEEELRGVISVLDVVRLVADGRLHG